MNPATEALPMPLFFDEKRFLANLSSGEPQSIFRDAIRAVDTSLNNRFERGEDTETISPVKFTFATA